MNRRSFTISVALLLLAYSSFAAQPEQTLSPQTNDRIEAWREDLHALFATLEYSGRGIKEVEGTAKYPPIDFHRLYPLKAFSHEIETISADIATLTDDEITLRLERLMASAHVAHNSAYSGTQSFQPRLPVSFRFLNDGLIIERSTPVFKDTLEAQVVRINGQPLDEILEKLRPYVSYEVEPWFRVRAAKALQCEAYLRLLHLVNADNEVELTINGTDGAHRTIAIPFRSAKTPLLNISQFRKQPAPLAERHPDSWYWFEYLENSKAFYIQYDRCMEDPKKPMVVFAREVGDAFQQYPIQRVIVDLRTNIGGNSEVIGPLLHTLKSHRHQSEAVYILIGPETISSGLMAAVRLRHELNARLVGEDTGGALGSYGNIQYFRLPHSKITIEYSIKYFDLGPRNTPLKPDLLTPQTISAQRLGKDVALDAAFVAR